MRVYRLGFDVIAAECPPQRRTVRSYNKDRHFLSFPYITFIIHFSRNPVLPWQKYPYILRVAFHNKSRPHITQLYRPPIGNIGDNLSCCMGGNWPRGYFYRLDTMAKAVISLFWQTDFGVIYGPTNMDLKDWIVGSAKDPDFWRCVEFNNADFRMSSHLEGHTRYR